MTIQNDKLPTREQYFAAAIPLLQRQVFTPAGLTLPSNVRVGVGTLNSRKAGARHTLGVCFPVAWSADSTIEITMSPVIEDACELLSTLCHELIHAIDGNKNGHRGPFRRMALDIGLTGKMTETEAGDDLNATLETIVKELGPYPHAKLDTSVRKKQGTRMMKVQCTSCGWSFRTSQKNINAIIYHGCLACDSGQLEY